MGRRNVKWPEVRLSPTPATPLHPPAASKDPQPPFCVFGSQIQQVIQCMWAILQVVSRSPSSVDLFHHIAYRSVCWPDLLSSSSSSSSSWTQITCSDSLLLLLPLLLLPLLLLLLLRVSTASFRLAAWGYSNGKRRKEEEEKKTVRQPSGNSLSPPAEQRQGSPRLSQTERYAPVFMDVQLGNTSTRRGEAPSVWPPLGIQKRRKKKKKEEEEAPPAECVLFPVSFLSLHGPV